jgi:hypothetical protein
MDGGGTMPNSNPLVTLLAQYCPSPENEAAFDESIHAVEERLGVRAPHVDSPIINTLLGLLTQPAPPHMILTGTAGDGKTHICRQIYQEFSSEGTKWGRPFVRTRLPQGKDLVVVKDFTELGADQQIDLIAELSAALYGDAELDKVFLIAANEGILTSRTNFRELSSSEQAKLRDKLGGKHWVKTFHADLSSALIDGREAIKSGTLRLFDLSRIPAWKNLQSLFEAVLQHEAWGHCEGCESASGDGPTWCPVFENLRRLRRELVQKRLLKLVRICEHTDEHLTMRHLLMMLANSIVGHAGVRRPVKAIVSCEEIPELVAHSTATAYFQNVFGANLSRSLRTPPFSVLATLGVGSETNNRIDHLLVYGDLDKRVSDDFREVLGSDERFGLTREFTARRNAYREGPPSDEESPFLEDLVAQRRRLFFEMPRSLAERYGHMDLTVFRSADEYEHEIVGRLRADQRVSEDILAGLVIGLNRVFVGALTDDKGKLLLATSGTTSQARVCDLLIHPLSHDPFGDAGVSVIAGRGVDSGWIDPQLAVTFRGNVLSRWRLTLSRYEFLRRVSEGVLPASFSPELYEDVLAFKSQTIRGFEKNIDADLGSLPIRVLSIELDGSVHVQTVEVLGDDSSADDA